jgi:flagellin
MVVQHNLSGMNANRQLNITTGISAKSSEKLSSGYRINRAADDAAGLAISEKMRRQIRGLSQGSDNAQDGISWCQIADGALNEVDDMLERVKELSVQASNETLTDSDRGYINEEVNKISTEIDRIHSTATFNEIPIFDGGLPPSSFVRNPQTGSLIISSPNGPTVEVTLPFVGTDGNIADVQETPSNGRPTSYGDTEFAHFVQDAAASAVSKLLSSYPKLFAAAGSPGVKVGLELGNIDGKNGTLAYAKMNISSTSESSVMSYTMKVDTTDFPIDSFSSMSAEKKANLAAVVAHEMTHLFMDDTLTSGMLSTFPLWFVEGMAQSSSGDNGWVSNSLTPSSDDSTIKNYMSKLPGNEYGAGYLATMYLGQIVSEGTNPGQSVTSSSIKNGLDTLMAYMASDGGHTLDEAIATYADGYSGVNSFVSGFKSGDDRALNFTKALLAARGENGAGSVLGNLGDQENSLFGSFSGSDTSNYRILTDNTSYANAFGSGYVIPDNSAGDMTLLYLQVGSENTDYDRIGLKRFSIDTQSITGGIGFDVSTFDNAQMTLDSVETAAKAVSSIRSYYGALQNRLEHTVKNLGNVIENTTASESIIRDTDMAKEMVRFSNTNILAQAGQSMLAQANQTNQGVLSLLQ